MQDPRVLSTLFLNSFIERYLQVGAHLREYLLNWAGPVEEYDQTSLMGSTCCIEAVSKEALQPP